MKKTFSFFMMFPLLFLLFACSSTDTNTEPIKNSSSIEEITLTFIQHTYLRDSYDEETNECNGYYFVNDELARTVFKFEKGYYLTSEDIDNFGYSYIISENEKDFVSAEHLKDYEMQYEYAVFIEFNSCGQIDENGNGNKKGSAIFLHCFGTKGYTGGCVAVARENMEFIMRFLDREKCPKILITK